MTKNRYKVFLDEMTGLSAFGSKAEATRYLADVKATNGIDYGYDARWSEWNGCWERVA